MSNRYPAGVVRKNQVVPAANGASGVWTIGQATQAVKSDIWPYNNIAVPIPKSLRFRQSSTTYLNRTPASAGSSTSFTFSFWTKRGALGYNNVYHSGTSNANGTLVFGGANTFNCQLFNSVGANYGWASTMVFRDLSAWYHIVVKGFASSSGNSFGGVELALYVNGVQQTFTGSAYNSPSTTNRLTDTTGKQIGGDTTNAEYYDGYLTDFYYIDGQSLDSSSFGSTNAVTGIWQPIPYSGTYGTNGFHLEFKDTTVGKDTSGNNNHWTPNNISTTLGSTYDLMTDVPTKWSPRNTTDVGGVVRGNYPVINPLDKGTNATVDNGNLRVYSSSGWTVNRATMAYPSTGKWYFEWIFTDNTPAAMTGIATAQAGSTSAGLGTDAYGWGYHYSGNKYNNNSAVSYGASYTTGDVIGVAFDSDTGTLTFYKNNSSQGTAYTGLTTSTYFPVSAVAGATAAQGPTINFGQQPFVYTPPSGYKALCTTNLPTPTIGATTATAANKYFDATLITGTAATQVITNAGGFQPDFIWLKSRTNANNPTIYDAIRGVNTILYPALTNAEAVGSAQLTAFNSNGFTLGASENANDQNGEASVGWQWNAGNSNTTNTSGSTTSIVRANQTAGFSVVSYTGTGANATIGHGLAAAPTMILVKGRTDTNNWFVYHKSVGNTTGLILNTNNASVNAGAGYWQNTTPSSSVFYIGNNSNSNVNGVPYIAYCWTDIPGYSAFGSYTGNGSLPGPFIYTGFRPKFVMIKRTDYTGDWYMVDTSRNTYNVMNNYILADSTAAEATDVNVIDGLSNGFILRNASGPTNPSGGTCVYAAFAENPFKNALAR